MSSHEGKHLQWSARTPARRLNVGGQVGEVGPFGLRVLFGDDILPGYTGILTNHYELEGSLLNPIKQRV